MIKTEPKLFGFLKGRWALGDISKQLGAEGISASVSTVWRILVSLDLVWGRPKLRAPGSIRKDYRKRKEIANYKRIAVALRKKGILVCFEDEKWLELLPKVEGKWMVKGQVETVPTPGYTDRRNYFITMMWPSKRFVWNSFERRRNIEYSRHLSSVLAYAGRHGMKKVILFVDHASYHETEEVKDFLGRHPELVLRFLPCKDPNMNPVERLVNKGLNSAVQCNRCYY